MKLATAPKTRLGRCRMFLLVLLVPVLLGAFHPVQDYLLKRQVMSSQTAPYERLELFAATFDDPVQASRVLWETGWLPHRHFAIEWLFRQDVGYAEMRPFMVDCLREPDGDLRESAMLWLTTHHAEENLRLLAPLVADSDPRVVRYAALLIGKYGNRQHASWLAPLLEPDSAVDEMVAFAAFQRWSGQDDGVWHSSDRLEQEKAGIYWRDWLAEQTTLLAPVDAAGPITRLSVPPPVGRDAAGQEVTIAAYGQKPVLLVFWSALEPNSRPLLANVRQVVLSNPEAVQVVLLSVDHLPSRHVGAGHDLPPELTNELPVATDWPHLSIRASLETIVACRAHNPPVTVLIDSSGRVCRRLDYVRAAVGLQRMLDDLDGGTALTLANKPGR